MRNQKVVTGWVVYKSKYVGEHGPNAVCEQEEWDAMELADPKGHTLIQSGVPTEAEAERMARELPGGTAAKGISRRAR